MNLTGHDKSAWFRIVVTYWDMAASLVVFEAIDQKMFNASRGELLKVFALPRAYDPATASEQDTRHQRDAEQDQVREAHLVHDHQHEIAGQEHGTGQEEVFAPARAQPPANGKQQQAVEGQESDADQPDR